jgi:hypothetical protein
MSLSPVGHTFNFYFDVLIAVLVTCLLLSIRITRKEYFGLTTEDLLVGLFFIALAPLVVAEFGRGMEIVRLVLRTAVLLYACEYLLSRGPATLRNLQWLSIGAILLMGLGV